MLAEMSIKTCSLIVCQLNKAFASSMKYQSEHLLCGDRMSNVLRLAD